MSGAGVEEARAAVNRICALAGEGRPESLAASAAMLEEAAGDLRRHARELRPELARLGRLAGQAAGFYAHCLGSAAGLGYTSHGSAETAAAAGRVALEG